MKQSLFPNTEQFIHKVSISGLNVRTLVQCEKCENTMRIFEGKWTIP